MSKVEIKSMQITIGKTQISLDIDEARELHCELEKIFHRDLAVTAPVPVIIEKHIIPWTYYPTYPVPDYVWTSTETDKTKITWISPKYTFSCLCEDVEESSTNE